MTAAVLINGVSPTDPLQAIAVEDRGLHYGDGLFESALLAQVSPAQENAWNDVEGMPDSSLKPFDRALDEERIERLRDAIERVAKDAG